MGEQHGVRGNTEKLIVPVLGMVGPVLFLYLAGFQALVYGTVSSTALLLCVGVASAFTPSVHRAGYSGFRFVAFLMLVSIVGTAYLRGGIILGVLGWLLFPPIMFALLFRIREAAVCLAVCAASVGVLFALEHFGLTPPRVESTPAGMLGGTLAALVGVSAIALVQAWSRQRERRQRRLMKRRLLRANKLESIARLAGGIAHDFNNLLTVITNHAQLLAEKGGNADVEAIQHAADVGTALTRRLLAIGRERDEAKEHEPIDVNGVGAKVASLFQTLLPPGIHLLFEAAPGPAVTRANPWDIHQVLMNLVLNARDAMPNGGSIELSVSLIRPEEPTPLRFGVLTPGPYVLLQVKDSGVGMSEGMMNKVVEPFFTTRGDKGGTGLGLSIVYGVTRAEGGHLDISSDVDKGTTFSIYLPYCDEAPIASRQREATSSFPASPAHVLLVDDDPAVLRALSRLMGLEGHEVMTANCPDDARQKFRDSDIDVLVTDVSMPGGSGVELATELLRESPELGIVFVSGGAVVQEPVETENVCYLTKPASRRELRQAVRAVGTRPSSAPRP
ncbi:MAG: ATP-binding protein [Polyangiales bacterium]